MEKLNEENLELSIILPCLNEEEVIEDCIKEVSEVINKENINAEIMVVDNNSIDKSPEIIKRLQEDIPNLIYVYQEKRGYGSAYHAGIEKSKSKYIFMADSDLSYSFKEIPKFLNIFKNNQEVDFIIGNRFSKEIKMDKKAMSWLHKYIGNPILSSLVRIFFGTRVRDSHCGMRGLKKEAVKQLKLKTSGMEFASEMVIQAVKKKLVIAEVPIKYSERVGDSKLKSFSDGWRHLRFILLYSPIVIFFIPGLFLFLLGLIVMTLIYFDIFILFGKQFIIHPIFISSLFVITGFQLISFAGFAKTYAYTHLEENGLFIEKILKYMTLEKALILGFLVLLLGLIIFIYIFITWINSNFGGLDQIKNSVIALTLIILGIQTISNSFMISILGIQEI